MDCTDAQRIISEALDGEPVAPTTIREAKEHCAGCRDCLGYVKTLAAANRAPLPVPPTDLADRVMTRVREEAETIAAEEVPPAASADDATASADESLLENAPVDIKALWSKLLRPENRRTVAIWAGAAAMLLVFVGVLAVSGVNSILRSGGEASAPKTSLSTAQRDSAAGGAQSAPEASAPTSQDSSAGPNLGGGSAQPSPTASYIVAGGFVYELVGPSSYARSNLSTGGTTSSSLDSSDPPKSLAYYIAPEKNKIVLDDGTGNLLVFGLVTRGFAGNQFALRSGDIVSFKTWPTLPPPMASPASADGTPQFQPAGTSMGVQAYVQSGTTADAGIAIRPNTPATDPAGGNPNWTWWTPLK